MIAGPDEKSKHLYEFGPFRVDPEKELLLRGDKTVPLTPKTFQILLVLIRHKHEVVTKDELLKLVWPDTFVEEANLSRNIFLLRRALGESPQDHQYIVTVPGHGYRFAEEVQFVPEQSVQMVAASHSSVQVEIKETKPWGWIALAACVLVAAAVSAYKLRARRAPVLTEKDTVVLADFANSTGDPVFDGTLRQGLAVELEQSPFLSLISDESVQQTLQLMSQPPDARLTPQIAHDLCQRTQSAAYLTGSIASLGSQYVIGLKAVNCSTGDTLDEEQETASSKEKVLQTLDQEAGRLREKLGESLSTVRKFNTPLEEATTPSLEAFQAYTLGRRTMVGKDDFAASVPFFLRAIQLDPNFAIAYATLGSVYWNLGEPVLGAEYATKAYALHAPVSEPERFYIETTYYNYVVGDLDKALQIYQTYAQVYPRSSHPPIRLYVLYADEGKYEEAVAQIRKAIQLDPWKGGVDFADLVNGLIHLDRLQEAGDTAQKAISSGFDSSFLRFNLYELAFLEDDAQGMAQQVQWVKDKPDPEAGMFELEAQTAAYSGKLNESRSLSRQAVEWSIRAGESESAVRYEANEALDEALFGRSADAALHDGPLHKVPLGNKAQYAMALSFALAGDPSRAQLLADDLARSYPNDTLVQFNFLPTIRAQIALDRHDPSRAIELLQSAAPYELSDVLAGFLGPVYVRGEAYLMAHKGVEAAGEFQKILDHRGVVANSPSGALAYLQLGRADVLSGDNNKAKTAYQHFLDLWKDADPDLPVFQQARAEYARLK